MFFRCEWFDNKIVGENDLCELDIVYSVELINLCVWENDNIRRKKYVFSKK